jgi:hypothetical protein
MPMSRKVTEERLPRLQQRSLGRGREGCKRMITSGTPRRFSLAQFPDHCLRTETRRPVRGNPDPNHLWIEAKPAHRKYLPNGHTAPWNGGSSMGFGWRTETSIQN